MTELQKEVFNVLQQSSTPMQVKTIYTALKASAPHICDDTIIPCPYCKQNHPLWQHQAAWALQYLKSKNMAHSTSKGYWQISRGENEVTKPPEETPKESLHSSLQEKVRQIGSMLGKYAKEKYPASPYIYDVIWKEVEGLPRPCHVFEVQDKGSVDSALAKLQHARDMWKPKMFLIVTGEKDRKKIEALLQPFMQGTFHGIRKDTIVLMAEDIEEIYTLINNHKEAIRQFLEI